MRGGHVIEVKLAIPRHIAKDHRAARIAVIQGTPWSQNRHIWSIDGRKPRQAAVEKAAASRRANVDS